MNKKIKRVEIFSNVDWLFSVGIDKAMQDLQTRKSTITWHKLN